jgi:quinoprotein glucose dehydrogenase
MLEDNDQASKKSLSRRDMIRLGGASAALPLLGNVAALCQVSASGQAAEWRQYAGDKASTKYSALDQINAANFNNMKIAWTWRSVEEGLAKSHNLKTWAWEATPLMVDGILYLTTSLSQAVALEAGTGKPIWVYDPETWKNGTPSNNGFVHRGVSYWTDGKDARIVYGTGDGYLICLHAKTGKPISAFGGQRTH